MAELACCCVVLREAAAECRQQPGVCDHLQYLAQWHQHQNDSQHPEIRRTPLSMEEYQRRVAK